MIIIHAIGHGSRSEAEFVRLLEAAGIECVVDVRAYPVSRRYPQFSRATLARTLAHARIAYLWEGAALGGRRQPCAGSPHTALKPDVRGFADHMVSDAFQQAIDRLMTLAAKQRSAIMCAEKLPSQCHRSFIADALTVRCATVMHLIDAQPPACHTVSELARVDGESLVYDRTSQLPLL